MKSPSHSGLANVLSRSEDASGLRKLLVVMAIRSSQGHAATQPLTRSRGKEEAKKWALLGPVTAEEIPAGLPRGAAYARLADVAAIAKGPTGIKDAKAGPYPLVVTAEARGSCDHFDFEGPAVLIPLVSSTGHGDASLKRIHYQDGKFAVGSILAAVQPTRESAMSARFLFEYLSAFKDELLVSRMSGTANVSLTVAKIGEVPIPLVSAELQERVHAASSLCDTLEAKGRLEAEQHASLLSTLLGTLTDSRSPEELTANWQRVAAHFDLLLDRPEAVDALEEAVLELAVRGLLTRRLADDEPAKVLLERVREERDRLVAAGEAKRDKSPLEISADEVPFNLPDGWQWSRLGGLLRKIGAGSTPLGGREVYVSSGIKFLRSQNVWNDGLQLHGVAFITPQVHAIMSGTVVTANDLLFNITGASIGRCAVVPADFDEANVSQHVTIVRPALPAMTPFLHAVMTSRVVQQRVIDVQVGVSREGLSVAKLSNFVVPVPPLAEQRRIVTRVSELRRLCADLRERLAATRATQARLADALIESAAG